MKKWTEIEDKLVLDLIPKSGILTKETILTLKRQLPDRSTHSIEVHWYEKLRKVWWKTKGRKQKLLQLN